MRIDWAGPAVLSGALVCLLLGVANANTWGWDSVGVLGLLAALAVPRQPRAQPESAAEPALA